MRPCRLPPPPQNRRAAEVGSWRPDDNSDGGGDGGDDGDPLAMTFTVVLQQRVQRASQEQDDVSGGCFLTSVDIFFSAKDENIPVVYGN